MPSRARVYSRCAGLRRWVRLGHVHQRPTRNQLADPGGGHRGARARHDPVRPPGVIRTPRGGGAGPPRRLQVPCAFVLQRGHRRACAPRAARVAAAVKKQTNRLLLAPGSRGRRSSDGAPFAHPPVLCVLYTSRVSCNKNIVGFQKKLQSQKKIFPLFQRQTISACVAVLEAGVSLGRTAWQRVWRDGALPRRQRAFFRYRLCL